MCKEKHAKPRGVSLKTWDNNWFVKKNIAQKSQRLACPGEKPFVAGDGAHGLR
jgi:hypothetical protein